MHYIIFFPPATPSHGSSNTVKRRPESGAGARVTRPRHLKQKKDIYKAGSSNGECPMSLIMSCTHSYRTHNPGHDALSLARTISEFIKYGYLHNINVDAKFWLNESYWTAFLHLSYRHSYEQDNLIRVLSCFGSTKENSFYAAVSLCPAPVT